MGIQQWNEEDDAAADKAADAAFSRLFSALPAVEPSAGFVQHAVDTAWGRCARRQRWLRWAAAAASLAVAAASSVLVLSAPAWLVLSAAQAGTGAIMTLLWSATAVAEFWGLMVSAGSAAARVAVMPQSVAVLVAIELLGAAALYSLHRLLRAEVRFRSSGPLCF